MDGRCGCIANRPMWNNVKRRLAKFEEEQSSTGKKKTIKKNQRMAKFKGILDPMIKKKESRQEHYQVFQFPQNHDTN